MMVDLLLSPLPYITDTGRVPFFLSQPLLVYSLFGKKTRHGNVTSPSVGSGSPSAGTRYPAVRFFLFLRRSARAAPPGKSPLWPESSA